MELLELIIARLTQAGYVYIGMDHFALPEDELVIARNKGTLQRNFKVIPPRRVRFNRRVLPRLAMWQAITAKTSKCFPVL